MRGRYCVVAWLNAAAHGERCALLDTLLVSMDQSSLHALCVMRYALENIPNVRYFPGHICLASWQAGGNHRYPPALCSRVLLRSIGLVLDIAVGILSIHAIYHFLTLFRLSKVP